VPLREAEGVEVVPGRLDLAAVDDLVAEPEEDVLDVAAHEGRGVERPAGAELRWSDQLRGQRDVDALGGDALLELGSRELLLPGCERGLDRLADSVERHAGLAVAHAAQRELQRAVPAEVVDAHLRERSQRPGRGSGGECLLLEVVGIHGGDLIQRFLLLSRARETAADRAPARAEETTLSSAPTPRRRAGAA